jgi:hypothetical protein
MLKMLHIKFHSKVNEKFWRNFKVSCQVIILTSHFCTVVISQVFLHKKLKIIATKVSKGDTL